MKSLSRCNVVQITSRSGHNVDTLKDLMDKETLRVEGRFTANDKAVELALKATEKASGTVNVVALVAVVAGIFSIISVILTVASLFIHR